MVISAELRMLALGACSPGTRNEVVAQFSRTGGALPDAADYVPRAVLHRSAADTAREGRTNRAIA